MPRFTDSFLDELRARVSIVDVIGSRVAFDPRKSNAAQGDYWACCPFHGEKTPSFHVDEKKGYFYCFGCHEKGSMFDFVMKLDRMNFPEAVEHLADRAGLPLPAADPEEARREQRRASLYDVTERALQIFRELLASPAGAEARAYLERRLITREAAERFEIGLAAGPRDGLIRRMTSEGIELRQLLDTDLAVMPKDGRGGPFDRFQNRLIFPIRDVRGRAIAFGGRDMTGKAQAKYLNSAETQLFKKKRSLYNHGPAREALSRRRPAEVAPRLIVAEGYMDVIALWQAGFEAAVAPLGTALGEEQLEALWKLAPTPVMALDGDTAGLRAADRTAERALPLLKPGRSLDFVMLPEGQDPDDFLKAPPPAGGPGALAALLGAAQPLVDRLFAREVAAAGALETPEARAGLEATLTRLAGTIADETLRRHYTRAFRDRIFAHFRAARRGGGAKDGRGRGRESFGPPPGCTPQTRQADLPGSGETAREAVVLLTLLAHPDLAVDAAEELIDLPVSTPNLDTFKNALLSAAGLLSDTENLNTPSLEAEVDAQLGHGACAALRTAYGRRAAVALGRGASMEHARQVLRDATSMIYADATLRAEAEEFALAAEDDEDAAAAAAAVHQRRLQQALVLARQAQTGAGEDTFDDDEAALNARLQSFIDQPSRISGRSGKR